MNLQRKQRSSQLPRVQCYVFKCLSKSTKLKWFRLLWNRRSCEVPEAEKLQHFFHHLCFINDWNYSPVIDQSTCCFSFTGTTSDPTGFSRLLQRTHRTDKKRVIYFILRDRGDELLLRNITRQRETRVSQFSRSESVCLISHSHLLLFLPLL